MSTEVESGSVNEGKALYAGFWIRFVGFFIDTLLLSVVSLSIINILYFVGFWTWRAQTLGQMAINVKVVRTDGKDVDLRTSLLRFLGYWVCFLTLGIGFLFVAFDSHKQGLHDKLANTYVVRVSNP